MKSILDELKSHIGQIVIGLISILFGKLIYDLEKYIPSHILNTPSTILWAKAVASLFLISIGLLVYSLLLRSKLSEKININDYKFIENPGYYSHKKHGGRYCHPCLLSGTASPLSKYDSHYMRCYKCNTEVPSNPIKDD
jgi:hypothetical protein